MPSCNVLDSRFRAASFWFAGFALALAGCQSCHPVVRAHLHSPPPVELAQEGLQRYTLDCPDVVSIRLASQPPASFELTVQADGCIALPGFAPINARGATCSEIAFALALQTGLPPERVGVGVANYASRSLFLVGAGGTFQQPIDYRGPERVTDVLRRIGGLAPSADTHTIHLVRPNVANGTRPDVYSVNLEAVFVHHDHASDVAVRPGDQIYVAENRRTTIAKCLPPWLVAICDGGHGGR